MLGFSLARLEYLDFTRRFAKGSSPGEWYWYRTNHYRIGITLHLGCILPAGLLMIWQFIPAIRHKASLLFHRINGYLVILLVLVSNAGALMIVRRSFGGELATQGAVGLLVIGTTIGLVMAYINIKRLQIDQHRAWMLRTMFYLGSIITTRLIMIIAAQITTMIGSYYVPFTCGELEYLRHYDTTEVFGTLSCMRKRWAGGSRSTRGLQRKQCERGSLAQTELRHGYLAGHLPACCRRRDLSESHPTRVKTVEAGRI